MLIKKPAHDSTERACPLAFNDKEIYSPVADKFYKNYKPL